MSSTSSGYLWSELGAWATRRFGRHVQLGSPRQCWEWTGPRDKDGYGRYTLEGRTVPAHREAYRQLVSPLEPFGRLRHLCRNPGCVNPDHLREMIRDVEWEERFWPKVDRLSRDECWQWKGAMNAQGYGVFYFAGRPQYAHRMVLYQIRRRFPEEKVTHTCGNRGCVNIRHLRSFENADRTELGGWEVLEIREAAANGETQASLAREYEVSPSMISRIVSRKRWANLEDDPEDW